MTLGFLGNLAVFILFTQSSWAGDSAETLHHGSGVLGKVSRIIIPHLLLLLILT